MSKMKPNGYWKNWSNVELEMRKAIAENGGEFPIQKRLQELGKGDLLTGLKIHYGGIIAIRERMGYKSGMKPDGYWENWNNVESEMKEAIAENGGEFPTKKRLEELGKNSLPQYVSKYHGGMSAVRGRMGYGSGKKLDGYWKEWSNVESEMKEAIAENGGEFPTQDRLVELGKSSLTKGMQDYHGGLRVVREKMGYGNVNEINALEEILTGYVE